MKTEYKIVTAMYSADLNDHMGEISKLGWTIIPTSLMCIPVSRGLLWSIMAAKTHEDTKPPSGVYREEVQDVRIAGISEDPDKP